MIKIKQSGGSHIQIMRLIVLALIMVVFLEGPAAAVNLVPNPSFELKTSCPTGISGFQITGVTVWTSPTTASPDYFHTCATSGSGVSVPSNMFGNEAPHTGQAYAGFKLRSMNQYREYLETPLTSPLVAGVAYNVSFYVSLADNSQWAIDKLGAYLSVGPVGPVNTLYTLSVAPQVANPYGSYLNNKSGWTLISGTYFALGGEDHLVIGTFPDDSVTTALTGMGGPFPFSYYYLDDVSVERSKKQGTCDLVVRKSPSKGSIPLTYGNPATFVITLTNQGTGACVAPLLITDSFSAGLNYVSGGTSGWACPSGPMAGPNSVTCTNNVQLAPGQSSSLLVSFSVVTKKSVSNCAYVKNDNDANTANNASCLELPVK